MRSVSLRPIHQAVAVFLTDQQGRFILQRRDNKPGIWNPGLLSVWGGAVEPGETVLEAAVREIWEETNLRPQAVDLIEIGPVVRPYAIGTTFT
jgi:8-oxo-dGTP pyrophosphatase MutT (NUDIX family)